MIRTVILFLLTLASAPADTVSYSVTPSGGLFSYNLTLMNTGTTGGTVFDLFLSVPLDISKIDTTTIGTPVGWGDSTGGLLFFGPDVNPSTSFIEWAADASGTYDVGIGSSLGWFSFVSSQKVGGSISFALNGSNTFDTAQELSSVPEPTTRAAVLLSLICAVLWNRKRRGKANIRWTGASGSRE